MEFSSFNIKKIPVFSQMKPFLIFSQIKRCILNPNLIEEKKSTPGKCFIF